ncbi:hypothetical protein [Acetivibrio cellulolyticus]|uniref:hypothetical protein n=1 Tax=Acetivibrio cellulolyticus TaxID=35830 RepID=UPI0001E2D8F3|nr:hypothetical protein [Acetivibrio cellulolyticus]
MYRFVTMRCRCCGTVMYNLPENEIKKIRHINLVCEDCVEHNNTEISNIINDSECLIYNGKGSKCKLLVD